MHRLLAGFLKVVLFVGIWLECVGFGFFIPLMFDRAAYGIAASAFFMILGAAFGPFIAYWVIGRFSREV